MFVVKMNNRINKEIPPLSSEKPIFNKRASLKAKWTYQAEDNLEGYQDPISKTQSEMINTMNQLYQLLKENNIKLSLAVYPWPQQIKYDDIESKHVQMWERFCIGKCFRFINFLPFFLKKKEKVHI